MSTWPATPAAAARSRASCACGSDSVMPVTCAPYSVAAWIANEPPPPPTASTRAALCGGVDRDGPPAAADVEHAVALLERELGAHEVALGELRVLQRRGAAREDPARVGHRLVEEEREVLVGKVVVVRDRALVAQDRVALALRPQLHLGHLRDLAQRAGLDRGERDVLLGPRVDRRRRPARDQRQRLVDVVDVDATAHVCAPEAELARRAQDVAEGFRRRQAECRSAVAVRGFKRRPVPQLEPERTLGERCLQRVLQRRCNAHSAASLAACRSGEILTTSQARPVFSRPQITHEDGSNCQGLRPWRADVGNAWWLLCHASPNVKNDSHNRLRDSSPVANCRRPKKWQSELMLYVEWCRTSIRTAPPHSRPVSASVSVPPISQPRRNGTIRPARTQTRNVSLIFLTTLSAI